MKRNPCLFFLSAIVIFCCLVSSCKKDDDEDPVVPATNPLYGTWNLAQENPDSYLFDNIEHMVFTSDNYIYALYEDAFNIRDRRQYIYSVTGNVFIMANISFKYTFKGDSLFLEFQAGRSFETLKLKKGASVDQSTWLKTATLGTPLFQVSSLRPIEGITWTGSKLWAIDEPWSTEIMEINPTTGTILTTVPVSHGYANIGYGNNQLLLGYVGNVFLHNPNTGVEESVLSFTDFAHIISICSDNTFIYFSTSNDNSESLFVKSNFSGSYVTSYDMDRVNDMTYGNGFIWMLIGTRVVKFDPYEMEAVDNYQISNLTLNPGNGAIGFINGELWIVDGANKFYMLDIH